MTRSDKKKKFTTKRIQICLKIVKSYFIIIVLVLHIKTSTRWNSLCSNKEGKEIQTFHYKPVVSGNTSTIYNNKTARFQLRFSCCSLTLHAASMYLVILEFSRLKQSRLSLVSCSICNINLISISAFHIETLFSFYQKIFFMMI